MSHLDFDGRQLLAELQEHFGSDTYQDVPECAGTDDAGRLRVVLDAAQRVVDIVLLDDDRLRTPADLETAFEEAWIVADVARLSRSLQASGAQERWERAGAEVLAGRATVSIGTPPDVSERASRERRDRSASTTATAATRPAPPSPVVSRSANGYLAVRRTPTGEATITEVDAVWLAAAQPAHLRRALLEAAAPTPWRAHEPQG